MKRVVMTSLSRLGNKPGNALVPLKRVMLKGVWKPEVSPKNDPVQAEVKASLRLEACPVCAYPLRYLRDVTPQRHINECLDGSAAGSKGATNGFEGRLNQAISVSTASSVTAATATTEKQTMSDGSFSTAVHTLPAADACLAIKAESPCTGATVLKSFKQKLIGNYFVPKRNSSEFPGAADAKQELSSVTLLNNALSTVAREKKPNESSLREFSMSSSTNDKANFSHILLRNDQALAPQALTGAANLKSVKRRRIDRTSVPKRPSYEERNPFPKRCPKYKMIPGTGISVDAFAYGVIPGCTAYFLSHFHSDHYRGLCGSFKSVLYCSKVTANLVVQQLRVKRDHVRTLPMGEWTLVENVRVLLIDANHCPGSVMFLIELSSGRRILHTGDFRASPELTSSPFLLERPIDVVYLDTTYCNPSYDFAPQRDVIQFAVDVCRKVLSRNSRTLICCGTYTIGKERLFAAIAKEFGFKVGVTSSKWKVIACLESEELNELVSRDLLSAQVHVVAMGTLTFKGLKAYLSSHGKALGYQQLLAFKPTGWTHSHDIHSLLDIKPRTSEGVTIYEVPYSEHSSFKELEHFVTTVRPNSVIPTVNVGSAHQRDIINSLVKSWRS